MEYLKNLGKAAIKTNPASNILLGKKKKKKKTNYHA